jgi:acyl carrier protein
MLTEMKNRRLDGDLVPSQLKHLVAGLFRLDLLTPDSIGDDELLIGGNFGLDSMDMLELDLCIEEEFGVAICGRDASCQGLDTIASLTRYICACGQSYYTAAACDGPSSHSLGADLSRFGLGSVVQGGLVAMAAAPRSFIAGIARLRESSSVGYWMRMAAVFCLPLWMTAQWRR